MSNCFALSSTQVVMIGRDPNCDIVVDSSVYRMVSRRHAALHPLPQQVKGCNRWLICDLNSSNGTFVNGQRLQDCQELYTGDRVTLGENGAEFIFEYLIIRQREQLSLPSSIVNVKTELRSTHTPPLSQRAVSFSQLFPILSTRQDLTRKAYLIPGIFTVILVVLMFATVGKPSAASLNQILVATYLAVAAYYFIYRLCGKHKPWWVLVSCAGATMLILLSPILPMFIFIFRNVLPGNLSSTTQSINFLELLVRMFVGAGLMEELLKAIPVLAAYYLGRQLLSPWRERIGVWEPLDGIILGTASAVGFMLLETLGQYVPEMSQNATLTSGLAGQIVGLQLLIPRVLGAIAGHMADSGYFGYFIGLSVLKPRQRWQILSVGYLSAAALHALWNTAGQISGLLLAVIGVLSYAFLVAAILKARMLSPTPPQ